MCRIRRGRPTEYRGPGIRDQHGMGPGSTEGKWGVILADRLWRTAPHFLGAFGGIGMARDRGAFGGGFSRLAQQDVWACSPRDRSQAPSLLAPPTRHPASKHHCVFPNRGVPRRISRGQPTEYRGLGIRDRDGPGSRRLRGMG